jgi:tetratricopeptide (TPR) repeat protein
MTHRHWSSNELTAFRIGEGATGERADDVATCTTCTRRLEEVTRFLAALSDPGTWEAVREEPRPSPATAERLRAAAGANETASREASDVVRDFQTYPFADWPSLAGELPPNEELARVLIDTAAHLLDTSPRDALHVLSAAEVATQTISRTVAAEYRTEIWKNRANALRMVADYKAALRATRRAARYTRLFPMGRFSLGQVTYTRATVLFKMGEYAVSSRCAEDAVKLLAEFGDRVRISHARSLQAAAATEEGRLDDAFSAYVALRSTLGELGDADGVARITHSLAVTSLRLGRLSDARKFALEAMQRFIDLGSTAEQVRVQWVLGTLRMREGDTAGAFEYMRIAVERFEALSMHGDAARVRLEMTGELLRRARWTEAEMLAREAAETFARNDARLHLAEALAYLRDAVARGAATAALVDRVLLYLDQDNGDVSFNSIMTR